MLRQNFLPFLSLGALHATTASGGFAQASEADAPTNPLKEAHIGEQHLHTGVSMDALIGSDPRPSFFQGPGSIKSTWKKNFEAAEKNYEPGKFAAIHAYEWSSMPSDANPQRLLPEGRLS
ncbi:DUF3604 domain-containing protein [Salipiger pacificus]|uniref:DUF3604 domain-containing protein n=1 Tax=Alloyangia sp. H15 TaxID=3029062 RepID=A0AAU8ASD8_9RHOB|nr:DUF3604 domain-containing protein [Alloyangia pacifica]MCA0946799.1 DUF3604 domain-containing protein [Alloyangia pacifica]